LLSFSSFVFSVLVLVRCFRISLTNKILNSYFTQCYLATVTWHFAMLQQYIFISVFLCAFVNKLLVLRDKPSNFPPRDSASHVDIFVCVCMHFPHTAALMIIHDAAPPTPAAAPPCRHPYRPAASMPPNTSTTLFYLLLLFQLSTPETLASLSL